MLSRRPEGCVSGGGGRLRRRLIGTAAVAALVGLVGCSPTSAAGGVALDYWLWDASQLPGYQKCVEAFEDENPDIDVRVSQYGWDDYWQKLTAGFVAGAGPDVFTDHLTKYPEFVNRGVLLPLGSLEATRDFDGTEFQEGLSDLWVGQDGKQYGMPKDFDTIALFYDKNTLSEAGLSEEDLDGLDWNPDDGGTFEDVIARLSVDANGVRGDEEGFDPDDVVTYGLASGGAGDAAGQTQWSWLAASTGWKHTNADVWGDHYNYDDPRFQKTMEWFFGLVDKGFMPPYEMVGTAPNPSQQLGSGQAALSANGSWMIRTYAGLEGIDLGIAKIPSGPVGHAVSMYNGLADSVSAQSEHPEEAARLVDFLGSDACQVIVGREGVVFPARPAGTEAAVETFASMGIDVTPFTELVRDQHTVYFPVTDHGARILSIMQPVMDEIYIGDRDVSTLTDVNQRINALFR